MLVERGASVSARNKDGWTALHLAPWNGHVDLAQMIVKHRTNMAPEATSQIATTTCVRVHAK